MIDNESRDRTFEEAAQAGGRVIKEPKRGYGHCVYRALQEALADPSARLICLCEGDMTFRAKDLEKLLAFIDHADIVNGTRIVEQLRDYSTQLSTFMYYGNFFVGKLLEFKHMGRGTFTDVGTTYKLVRRESLERLMPLLNPKSTSLSMRISSIPHSVTVNASWNVRLRSMRGSASARGATAAMRARPVGLRMIAGLVFGWKARPRLESRTLTHWRATITTRRRFVPEGPSRIRSPPDLSPERSSPGAAGAGGASWPPARAVRPIRLRDGVPKVGCDMKQAPMVSRRRDHDIELAVAHSVQDGTGVEFSEALLVRQQVRLGESWGGVEQREPWNGGKDAMALQGLLQRREGVVA